MSDTLKQYTKKMTINLVQKQRQLETKQREIDKTRQFFDAVFKLFGLNGASDNHTILTRDQLEQGLSKLTDNLTLLKHLDATARRVLLCSTARPSTKVRHIARCMGGTLLTQKSSVKSNGVQRSLYTYRLGI